MRLRVRGRAALLVVALVATVAGPASAARADVTTQGCSARAVVVVEPGPGPVTICFDGSISGLDALQLAGANPVTYGFSGQGAAVCQLFGVGNSADSSCLIGPDGQYWAYYRAGPGASGWTYSRGGASSSTVTDGSVKRVAPNDPGNSFLILKLADQENSKGYTCMNQDPTHEDNPGPCGLSMPQGGATLYCEGTDRKKFDAIAAWIAQGAQKN